MDNKDKTKRASSFLDKLNTFSKGKSKDKKDRPKSDSKGYRNPTIDENEIFDFDKMPDAEVNAKFEELLDDMNLSEDKKAPLRSCDISRKKDMLKMNLKGKMQSKGKVDTARDFINALRDPELRLEKRYEVIESLRVALTSNPVSWVQEFGTHGLNAILKNLTYCYDNKAERRSTQECVKCLRAFVNNRFGLLQIISHEEALTILARSIDPRDPPSMLEAVRLIAGICLVPPDGHDKALEGITICGEIRGQDRFMPIIQGLALDDVQLKVACMQLINAIVSTPDDLDFRLHLRNEFMRAGLLDALEGISHLEIEELKTQVNCFNDHKEEDHEDWIHRFDNVRAELDEIEDCFELLKNITNNTQAEPYFLSILQHMLFVRDDVIARPQYFKLIEECVTQIVLHKSGVDPDFRYTKRFEIDVDPLIGKLAEDSIEDGAASGVAPRNFKNKLEEALTAKQESEAKVNTLETKVQQYEQEINDLKSKISSGVGAAVSAAIGGGPPPPPPPPLPGGVPPPPPPPGGVPPPPPFPGGPPPPPPPPFPGGPPPPPPPPGGGPPPPPPFPGAPPPPGAPPFPGAMRMPGPPSPFSPQVAVLPYGMKPKKKYEPSQQLKRANWNKINAKQLEKDSFWVKANEDSLESKDIFEGLVENFSSKVPTKKVGDGENVEKKPAKKGKELKVLDPKTGQNLSILLGSIKVPYEEIKRRILECDEENLSVAVLEQLIKFMPEPEQINAMAELKNEYQDLSEPEQFGVVMSSIKRIVPRLKSMVFKMKFQETVSEIKPSVVAATAGLEEVKQSGKFAKMLELILLMGNYMNAGSRNAQSLGFEINYLTKLSNTKAHDNKTTLLHFLVDTVGKKFPEISTYQEELMHIEQAARVSDEILQKNIKAMGRSLKELETDIKNAKQNKMAPPNDNFVKVMDNFYNQAKEQHEVLEGMYKTMNSLFEATAKFYAFDPKKYTMEEFFSDIKTFNDQWNEAQKELVRLKEQEEKIKRAKEAQERREREKMEKAARKKALVDITADDDQEGVMDNLLEALKTGSAFAVTRERKEGRRRTPRAAGAERRAQLVRSRSRSNVLQGQSPDVVREINFDEESENITGATPKVRNTAPKSRGDGDNRNVPNGNVDRRPPRAKGQRKEMQMSEAEELLKRLKEL